MDDKPTLSQTWAVNKSQPAICVQSVDAHMSCSSHSDAQFAAFFIDPRAKWSTAQYFQKVVDHNRPKFNRRLQSSSRESNNFTSWNGRRALSLSSTRQEAVHGLLRQTWRPDLTQRTSKSEADEPKTRGNKARGCFSNCSDKSERIR